MKRTTPTEALIEQLRKGICQNASPAPGGGTAISYEWEATEKLMKEAADELQTLTDCLIRAISHRDMLLDILEAYSRPKS